MYPVYPLYPLLFREDRRQNAVHPNLAHAGKTFLIYQPAALNIEETSLSQCLSDHVRIEALRYLPAKCLPQNIVDISALFPLFRCSRRLVQYFLAESNTVSGIRPLHPRFIIGTDGFETTPAMEDQKRTNLPDGCFGITGAHTAALIEPRLEACEDRPCCLALRPSCDPKVARVLV